MHIMNSDAFRACAEAIANLRPCPIEGRVTADQVKIALVEHLDIVPACIVDDVAGGTDRRAANLLKFPLDCPTKFCQLNAGLEATAQEQAPMTDAEIHIHLQKLGRFKPSSFKPMRGGHAPSDLREAFVDGLDDYIALEVGETEPTFAYRGRQVSIYRLTGLLWNCSDIMPSSTCRQLYDLALRVTDDTADKWRGGQTYAKGARLVRLYLEA